MVIFLWGGVTYLPKNTDFYTLQEAGTYCFDIDSGGTESNAPVVQDTNRHWLVEVIKSKSIYYGTCIMRAYCLNYKDEIYYNIGYINNTLAGSVTWTAWKLVKLQDIAQQPASSDVPVTQPGIDGPGETGRPGATDSGTTTDPGTTVDPGATDGP